MKKTLLYATIAATTLFSSCNLDINENPNKPSNESITADLIFPSIGASIAACVGGEIYNYTGFFSQYFEQMPEANQYNEVCDYTFKESSDLTDYSYSSLFAGAMEDIEQVKEKTSNTATAFAATVLRAYVYQVFVDMYNDIPYTEALQGSGKTDPKWDDGQTVYEGILQELDDAEEAINATALDVTDMIFDKNLAQWKGFANALRLRMYLRFIDANVNASAYTEKVKTLVQANEFFTGDVKLDCFSNEANKRNPFYTTNAVGLAGNHVLAFPLISYLNETEDPRISYGISKAKNTGTYVGVIPGSKTTTGLMNADVSNLDYSIGATKPVYFFTQAELQFLIAESYLRFMNNDAKARAAYEEGVATDFAVRGLTGQQVSLLNGNCSWDNAASTSDKLELIYMQKWVSLFYMDHMEAWSEIRRTDYPKLSSKKASAIYADNSIYTPGELIAPWINGLETGGLVKRFFYPETARKRNKNTPTSVPASTPVWWDVK